MMIDFSNEQTMLLMLLRRALWNETCEALAGVDWEKIDQMAKEQGVISLVYDGARQMNMDIPAEILGKWKQKMLQGVIHNERLLAAQDEIIAAFGEAKIPAAILKGSSVARYYPQPGLRVLGDTDILVRKDDVPRAKAILEAHHYAMHESDHSFHIGFKRADSYVELHHNVTSFPDSTGGKVAEGISTNFLGETQYGNVDNHRFPVLTEMNQALCLLLHMVRHMFISSIGLRQLCDWAMYVASTSASCWNRETIPLLKQCGLLQYAKVATKTCVKYLGLAEDYLIWCGDAEDGLCHAFLMDTFRGGNMGKADTEGMGSLFTDHRYMGAKNSALKSLFLHLTGLVYKQFPWVERWRILLPVFWIFLPVRYWVRSVLGLRPKKSVNKVIGSAMQSRHLYDRLKVFETDNVNTDAVF